MPQPPDLTPLSQNWRGRGALWVASESYFPSLDLDSLRPCKPLHHHPDRLLIAIHQQKVPTQLHGGHAGGAAAGEEIEHEVAGVRRCRDDPSQNAERLLGWIAGLFLAGRADDRVPPDIRWQLAARYLLRD